MEDFLRQIGISGDLEKSDGGSYVMDIVGSENYGKIFSKLDRSDLVEEDEDSYQITAESSTIIYNSDEYTIILQANFETDEYKLIVKEN